MRAALYYVITILLMTSYGGEVCSLIETLSMPAFSTPMAVVLLVAWGLRQPLQRLVVQSAPPLEQLRRQFLLEFALFLGAGVAIALYNRYVHGFELGSGGKVVLGFATLGLFFSLCLALAHERVVMDRLARDGRYLTELTRVVPLTYRFALLAVAIMLITWLDIALVIRKDLEWVTYLGPDGLKVAKQAVLLEIGVVMGVLLVLILHVLFMYAHNLRRLFANQTQVLELVARGELDQYVAVSSMDELGLIAAHTNHMIDGLRERRRIKDVFGKMVSPEVGRQLLALGEKGLQPGGSRRFVAVLFSDVRNFTTRAEDSPPEQVVADLNAYFSEMVAIVHAYGGIVDKFIGDGMMAVFGLDAPKRCADQAVKAGLEMLQAVSALNRKLGAPLEIGIGIHVGEVVAGLIGSPERLEYTFIGDTVNTSARLEGLCKALKVPLLISAPVRAQLEGEGAGMWTSLGTQPLKGRTQQLEVFGRQDAA